MSLTTGFLNFQANNKILERLQVDNTDMIIYNKCYENYIQDPSKIDQYIKEQIELYISNSYRLINSEDSDINYYIEHINLFLSKKFKNIIQEINIQHIISLCDYFKNNNATSQRSIGIQTNYYNYWRTEYYKIVYNNIIHNEYKPIKSNKNNFINLFDELWSNINFVNLVEFTNSLNKIKFLGQNVDPFIEIIKNKFDSVEYIKKLINYINKKFEYSSNNEKKSSSGISKDISLDINVEEEEEEEDELKINLDIKSSHTSKYNFRFIMECLKSNGFLLFEEFNKIIKDKYKKNQCIQTIRNDKRIINYFIYFVSQKDSNSVNRKVNEILIRMKYYLEDIEQSYYNNFGYQKITIKQESKKYKSVDLSSYNRKNATFTIFKYSNINSDSDLTDFKINRKIEPYFDMYKSYYNSRYPDREIEFNPYLSTMIVKLVFLKKIYYVHMALIQYIVLDKLFAVSYGPNIKQNTGLNIKEISDQINIPIKNLEQTINSLLQIKLIKRSAVDLTYTKPITDIKFSINLDFENESRISISHLVISKEPDDDENKKEFLHDRNTIILSNIYDSIKKNRTFTSVELYENIKKNIPFKINLDHVDLEINKILEKEHIELLKKTGSPNINTYKYLE